MPVATFRLLATVTSPLTTFEKDVRPLDICVLSLEEAGRLEVYGIWPRCKAHIHMKKNAAELAIRQETHRFVGGPNTKIEFATAIVPVNTSGMWGPVQCHDYNGKTLQGFRTWGLQPTG